ncbi:C40 family peptidase [Azohydromonas aeria]|uniref:C40 family peptidase n=1 Tax=Azohydromonas aeria TaxID=2590212 RepID=UPI0012FB9F2C|nr:C40 family peptidase [Azohydromonas aeria]
MRASRRRLLPLLAAPAVLPLLLQGCATAPAPRPATPNAPAPRPLLTSPGISRLSEEQGRDATVYALGLVGTPYRWGGNTPESGFDCSGLIAHVYRHAAGVASPRSTAELQGWGGDVPVQSLRSGDLVLFGASRRVTHAGIFVGNDRFVHAPSTGGQVRLERMSAPYWSQRLLAVRRP